MLNNKRLIFPRQKLLFMIGFVLVNIFGIVECVTHFTNKSRDLTLDGTKIFILLNNLYAYFIMGTPTLVVQILLDSFSSHIKNIQFSELSENIILYKIFDKAFGLYFFVYFLMVQILFITSPFLAISSLPSFETADQDDYVRSSGIIVQMIGAVIFLFILVRSVENTFVSLQEKTLDARIEITETSSKREKQKMEYLLLDLHHLKPLTALGLFDINLKILTGFATVR